MIRKGEFIWQLVIRVLVCAAVPVAALAHQDVRGNARHAQGNVVDAKELAAVGAIRDVKELAKTVVVDVQNVGDSVEVNAPIDVH